MKPIEKYKKTFQEEDFLDLNSPEISESKNYKEICCPKCDNRIKSKNLNIDDKIAKCSSCDIVFSFENDIASFSKEISKTRQRILRPEGIEMFHFNDELELSFKQAFSLTEQLMLILVPFFSLSIVGSLAKSGLPSLFIISPFFVSFLVAIIYYIVRRRQIKYIKVDSNELRVLTHPNVLKTTVVYAAADISQLYVKKNSSTSTWNVMMLVDEGEGQKHIKLSHLRTASKAKFLEQEIESYLNIQDVILPEETN